MFERTRSTKELPGLRKGGMVSKNDSQHVMLSITENPHSCIRSISGNFNLSNSSLEGLSFIVWNYRAFYLKKNVSDITLRRDSKK